MAGTGLRRTDYWNRNSGVVSTGSATRTEVVTDVEDFQLPYLQAAIGGLHLWGVAAGLAVTADPNKPGLLTVAPGSAIDSAGHLIALTDGGFAVVKPDIDPTVLQNIPTVPVGPAGVALGTSAVTSGTHYYLTVAYQEAATQGPQGNAPTLVHAPWLRLLDIDTIDPKFFDDQIVLAHVTLANGNVTELSSGLRRLAGLPVERLQLRRSISTAGATLTVDQDAAAELTTAPDGSLNVDLLGPGAGTRTALSIDAATANVAIPMGNLGIGIGNRAPARAIHVEGSVIHSGGANGGFSFGDRTLTSVTDSFIDSPHTGQRWELYSFKGLARLWCGTDILTIGPFSIGLDVARRMRVRRGFQYPAQPTATNPVVIPADDSAGIWFFHDKPSDPKWSGDRGFVGLQDDNHIGFWGNTGAGWGLTMDISTGAVATGTANIATANITTANITTANISAAQLHSVSADRAGVTVFDSGNVLNAGGGFLEINSTSPTPLFVRAPTNGEAAHFAGTVRVDGQLIKPGGSFRIDHPLDPENKYLSHSFVESPDMLNIYRGTVTTDHNGEARVDLPDYFTALNQDFCYQLTPVGTITQVAVLAGVEDNRFVVGSERPQTTISWQLTGVRKDPWAQSHRIHVEEDKTGEERGRLLHPYEYGRQGVDDVVSSHGR